MFNFLGVVFAGGDECGEFDSFVGGQGDFVNLFHGNFRVRETMNKG